MKTKFAKEKSAYSHALHMYLDEKNEAPVKLEAMLIMKEIEQFFKANGDEVAIIVTTRDTNPLVGYTAPPMSEKDIKNQ